MSGSKTSGRRQPARHPANKCDSCHRNFYSVPRAPILQDAVRCKLAADNLCVECCFKRAFERRIDLKRASLRLCPVNMGAGPGHISICSQTRQNNRANDSHISTSGT